MVAENLSVKDIIGIEPTAVDSTIAPFTKPEKWVMPTCLVMRQAFQGVYDDEDMHKVTFINGRHGYYDDFTANVQIGYQELEDTIPHQLTRYDKVVYGAVVSLFVHHREQSGDESDIIYITPQMIYRTFRGDWKPKLPTSEATAIVESLHKMNSISIEIVPLWTNADLSALKGDIDRYRNLKGKGRLLNGAWVRATFKGGHQLDCFMLRKIPFLYRLGDKLHQVARQDIALMYSKRRYTQLVPQLRQYLLEHIAAMKGNNRYRSNSIKFDTIYENILPKNPSKEQLESVRAMTVEAMADFKEQGFISDYEQPKRGINGRYTKIEVQVGKSRR